MLEKIKNKLMEEWDEWGPWRLLCVAFVIILPICTAIAIGYDYVSTEQPVTTTTQTEAETVAGVKESAENANVSLDETQTKQVSETIREIRITEQVPVYIVQTTGDKTADEVDKAQKKAEADFSIVTSADEPDKEVKLDELTEEQNVTLNQYNINAFKKHLNTIEYTPSEKVLGYTHQWKVTDSGRYMGIGIDYDMDDKKVYAKVTYTW